MKRFVCGVLLVPALVVLPACSQRNGQDEQSKRDREALQGAWEVVAAEANGEPPPPGLLLIGAKFTFSSDKSTLLGKEGTFELDATQNPRRITLLHGRVRQVGIYELNKDDFKCCVGPPDDPPTEFKTRPRTDHTLLVLKRKW